MMNGGLRLTATYTVLAIVSACGSSRGTSAAAPTSSAIDSSSPSSKTASTSPAPSIASTSTKPQTLPISGSVSYLSDVGFTGGSGRELSFRPPRNGSPCRAAQGFNDIAPGAAVTISSNTNQTLATVALRRAGTMTVTRHSTGERAARTDLIDSIYGLRISKTWNAVEQADLSLAQAKQHLYDDRHPNEWGFGGAKFVAVWCSLPFTAPHVPTRTTYVVRVANRAPTVESRKLLDSNHDSLDLYLD
jgi:hypothetical protein